MVKSSDIALKSVKFPCIGEPEMEPRIPEGVYARRLEKVLGIMKQNALDYLFIYGDREHYSNFEYLSGFDLRFEEGLLMLSKEGEAVYMLGNEMLPAASVSRIPAKAILHQAFSLPSQPIDKLRDLSDILSENGLRDGHKVGIIGWKLMAPRYADRNTFDVPQFILAAIEKVSGPGSMINVTDYMIDPAYGVRIINTADDIAYLEYGGAWASINLIDLLENLKTGVSELEMGRVMRIGGAPQSSHPLVTVGDNNDAGLVAPGNRKLELGERFNCCVGMRGGLSCRTGYIAYGPDDLPEDRRDYLDVLVKPYYAAVVNWYENVKIGAKGADIFRMIQSILPKEKYNWKLNPGHYVSTEEWVSSPFTADSTVEIKSGMCIQMDIIPSISGYAGANCEDGVAIADEALRNEIKERYPRVWERIQARRRHMIDILNIHIPEEMLPLSNTCATYHPYLLNKDQALVVI